MNSFPPSLADLLKQRQDLEIAEQAFKNRQQLSQKRELLEEAISNLQKEIEENFRQFYNNLREEDAHFQNLLSKKQHDLRQLKQTQSQLDHLLDETEDLTEESLERQFAQLLFAMWQLYPTQRAEQEAKWQELNNLRLLEVEVLGVKQLLHHLSEQLHTAIQARQSIKGRGIFNYIFGISPNMIIERQFLGAHAGILKVQPLLQKIMQQSPENSPLHLLAREILVWSDHLKPSCQAPWSFRHIDTIFSKAYHTLLQLLERLQLQEENLHKRIEILNAEIRSWIQQLGSISLMEDRKSIDQAGA
jgi:hypothetical protein